MRLQDMNTLTAGQKFHLRDVPDRVWQVIVVPHQYCPERPSHNLGFLDVKTFVFSGFMDEDSCFPVVVID